VTRTIVKSPVAGDQPASVDGTAVRDDAGSPSRSSSGGSPVATSRHILGVVRGIEQPFTVGTLVRATEREGVPVSQALRWLRDALGVSVTDTGARRHSANALRGARLYRLR
jgi:hypothetical protein